MNKITAKRLAEKYGMEIVRNPITNEAHKLMVESIDLIPELDALTEEDTRPCMVTRKLFCGTTCRYEITCPPAWFDLWGWTDDSYRLTYERNGRTVVTVRKAATAQAAAEALCDQYGWGFRLKQYDADTRGCEWAECAAATDAYTDGEIAIHAERV